jgi:hypothetical protein
MEHAVQLYDTVDITTPDFQVTKAPISKDCSPIYNF